MQARGPLMIEHRLSEKMIALIKERNAGIGDTGRIDPCFVAVVVDYFMIYADRTHHGKEEEILFRELDKKDLSSEDRNLMEELIEEHALARKITGELDRANNCYRAGDEAALAEISEKFTTLIDFYPRHIKKEDDIFFPHSRNYLSEEEEQKMLEEFWEFDRRMIHKKYQELVDSFCVMDSDDVWITGLRDRRLDRGDK